MGESYQTTLEAALLYASLGWSVFPTEGAANPARAKHPALREVAHWAADSTDDPQQIAAWFSGTDYGIGVDCGKSNIVALDADRVSLIPNVSLGDAWSLRGNPERRSFIFDQPEHERIGCARGKWAAGEVKGQGGYICLPPGYHPVGGHYVWLDTSGSRRMPDDVREMLQTPERLKTDAVRFATAGQMCAVVERAVDKRIAMLVNLKVGRYPQMVSGMYELAALGAEGHEGTYAALLLLREAYVLSVADERPGEAQGEWDRAAKGLGRGLGVTEQVVCGGGRCEAEGLGEASMGYLEGSDTELEFERSVIKRVAQLKVDAEARQRIKQEQSEVWVAPMPTPLELLALEDAIPDRIQGLLNSNGTALLVAQRKTGKTTVIGNVVRSLCDGLPLFDRYPTLPEMGKVGMFDLEMTPALLGKWLNRLNIARPEALNVYSCRGRVGQTFSILNDDPKAFGVWLASQGITTLIIDPLAPLLVALGIDEADNSGVRKFLTLVRDIAGDAGVGELILSHHAGWSETGRSRGASSFEDAPDVIWRLQREGDSRLFSVIGRTQEIEPCPITLDEETGALTLSPNEMNYGDF